jgi:23S rRNA (pseudouridine1915-N3)-methyltransferase
MIRILAVGKKHEAWVAEGIARYEQRLRKPFEVEWGYIPHSSRDGEAAKMEDSRAILARISTEEYVILLDERGTELTSLQMSAKLAFCLEQRGRLTFIIGGAYGVDAALRNRADAIWSLSKLVFPHQLVRLILAEQLYRGQEIWAGRGYHHE